MRLLLLAATALLGGGPQTIAGTITANTGGSITVKGGGDRSLTCTVPDRGSLVILKWGTGVHVGMACKQDGGRLVLVGLKRLGTKEPQKPKPTEPTTTTTTTTTAPRPGSYAIGVVTALYDQGVAVKPDNGGELLKCAITQAADSQAAAAKLKLGAHVGIVCRPDGDHYVLAGATVIDAPKPPTTTTTTTTDYLKAIGVVVGLEAGGVAVKPDSGGELVKCAITPAPDSQAAAAKLKLGARVGILCRPDGGRYVLSGATVASS